MRLRDLAEILAAAATRARELVEEQEAEAEGRQEAAATAKTALVSQDVTACVEYVSRHPGASTAEIVAALQGAGLSGLRSKVALDSAKERKLLVVERDGPAHRHHIKGET